VVGPILFIVVFLIEGATRPGYSSWRNFVSQLSTGETGWVQVVNFLVFGTLLLAFALGLRQSLKGARGAVGAPVLFALVGIAILMAGVFTTDPALGYPPGEPEVQTTRGIIHGLAGLATFTVLPAAAFVMAWHFGAQPRSRIWVIYSIGVGLVIVVFFVLGIVASDMDQSGTWPNAPTGIFQRIAIIAGFTWISMVALHLIRKETASQD
jgi:hypothetical protein